ncbi:MAG TPA: hypothetical protein VFX30_04480 [bacterium]|nr:hypothetical protein [bacterium]
MNILSLSRLWAGFSSCRPLDGEGLAVAPAASLFATVGPAPIIFEMLVQGHPSVAGVAVSLFSTAATLIGMSVHRKRERAGEAAAKTYESFSIEELRTERSRLEFERDTLAKAEDVESKGSGRYPRIVLALNAVRKDLRRVNMNAAIREHHRRSLHGGDLHMFPYGYGETQPGSNAGTWRAKQEDYVEVLQYAEEKAMHPLVRRLSEDESRVSLLIARLRSLVLLEESIAEIRPEDVVPEACDSEINRLQERIAVLTKRIERSRRELERLSIETSKFE